MPSPTISIKNETTHTFPLNISDIELLSSKCKSILYPYPYTAPRIDSITILYTKIEGVAHCSGSLTEKTITMNHDYFSSYNGPHLIAELNGGN